MSRHHHATATVAEAIQHDIQHMSREQLEETYGIEIDVITKVVSDPVEGRTFADLAEWVTYEVTQDEMEFDKKFGHGKQTHEDYH